MLLFLILTIFACRYGDLKERGVRGIVLEAFGVGNMPDLPKYGWLPWLRKTVKQGVKVRKHAMLVPLPADVACSNLLSRSHSSI